MDEAPPFGSALVSGRDWPARSKIFECCRMSPAAAVHGTSRQLLLCLHIWLASHVTFPRQSSHGNSKRRYVMCRRHVNQCVHQRLASEPEYQQEQVQTVLCNVK